MAETCSWANFREPFHRRLDCSSIFKPCTQTIRSLTPVLVDFASRNIVRGIWLNVDAIAPRSHSTRWQKSGLHWNSRNHSIGDWTSHKPSIPVRWCPPSAFKTSATLATDCMTWLLCAHLATYKSINSREPFRRRLDLSAILWICMRSLIRVFSSSNLYRAAPGSVVELSCPAQLPLTCSNVRIYWLGGRWLYNNQLSGSIPSTIGSLTALQTLYVSYLISCKTASAYFASTYTFKSLTRCVFDLYDIVVRCEWQ